MRAKLGERTALAVLVSGRGLDVFSEISARRALLGLLGRLVAVPLRAAAVSAGTTNVPARINAEMVAASRDLIVTLSAPVRLPGRAEAVT
ncbi:MAG: hypothetical protein WBV43_09755 [Pseudolabrys sp.]|jgi:hypothetical protein